MKNEFIDVVFEDLTHDGAGVAKVKGYPIFVKTDYREEAQIKIVKVKKNFAFGRLMKLHTESPYRKEAECPVYNQCGGCQLQHLTYEGQLQAKENKCVTLCSVLAD